MSEKYKKTINWSNDSFDEIIDVRSPSEYNEDHIIGAKNYPVLYDDERVLIGKTYKTVSPFKAKILGSSIIAKNISKHIKNHFSSKKGSWRPLIYCWRGGQRSVALSLILSEIGWRTTQLKGGYKYYRAEIIKKIDKISPKLKIILISGKTGTGKTKIINSILENNGQALDLEGLANHKGSLLGKIINKQQPTQKFFESLLYSKMTMFNLRKTVYVEAESSKIGNLHIPKNLWKNMLSAKKIQIKASIDDRVNFLLNDYDYMLSNQDLFEPLLKGLEKKIDKNILNKWNTHIKKKQWENLVTSLLENHYDPTYKNNFDEKNQKVYKSIFLNYIDKKNINIVTKKILKT